MTQALIRKALEDRLATMSPLIQVIHENTGKSPPADEVTPYCRAFLMPAQPDNIVHGATKKREYGIFQVSLLYQGGKGPNAASVQADVIQLLFKRGTSLTTGGITVQITHTPHIGGGYLDGGRWSVPVTIRWQAWVNVN